MALPKGVSGNPGGKTDYEKRLAMKMRKAGVRATEVLINTMDSDDARLSYDAAKYVYEVIFGKPKTQATVDITHELGPAASHAVALAALAKMATPSLNPSDTANSLISLNNSEHDDKLAINHAPIEDAEVIDITPETAPKPPKTGGKRPVSAASGENTPPPPVRDGG